MQIAQPNVTLPPKADRPSAEASFQVELEHRFNELKADIAKRPFLYSGIAFCAGFASNTFPARLLFVIVARLLSWLSVPAILLLGIIKVCDVFFDSRRNGPTLVQRP